MRSFRTLMHRPLGRILTGGVLVATLHAFAEPSNYLAAVEAAQQKEARIREIAAKMNVDPEFLLHPGGRRSFDFRSLFNSVATSLGLRSETVTANAQPESVRESIAKVKERYAMVAADTTLAKVAQLVELAGAPAASRGRKKGQIKAEMQSVLRLIDKDLLPAVKDGLPGAAQSRDRDMRNALKELRKDVKDVLNEKDAFEDANLDATLAKLKNAVSGKLTLRNTGPRWTRDPFPVKDTYKAAPVRQAPQQYDAAQAPAAPPPAAITSAAAPKNLKPVSNAVAGEVAALATSLGTPAKVFSWVHDRVEWESYSGVAKGALGTMKEGRGNDWDQALLLRDLLVAQGYQAQLEWGRVTLPIQKAMNLVGTEDPLQAANLLATAGFDGLLLTRQNAPIAVQMTHVWVRAFIPYIPNRGAKAGTPDTWVRMDPSFKRYEYQAGIPINGKVVWNQDEYLNTSAIRPPSDFYGDKIWSYIRSNNIDCINLSQVAKLGRVKAENFPFVPSTLTTKIDEVRGIGAAPPADQVQNVTIDIVTATGAVVGTFTTAIADVWGKKLSLTFPPATPDDAAVIASYGGLFNTPPYLIRLKPVFSLDDQPVAEGTGIAAGAALDMNLTFRQPNVADDATHHQVVAGETHALVLDAGAFPDSLVQSRIERLKALTAANASEDAIRSEQLHLVGLRYMQHVDDGIAFATGVRWQRAVKRVFEADVRRQIDITYNVAGAPMRLEPAENNIDVSRLLVGIIPINNDPSNKAEALALAGLQSSYLEGSIWEEMNSVQGISAAKALLLSRAQGQQLHTVTASNVDAVLNAVTLDAEVEAEIRGSVAQGRIAKIPSAEITLGRWTGTGYILQDPRTGAATYPISGGLAGGSATEVFTNLVQEILGAESWMEATMAGDLVADLLEFIGLLQERPPSTRQSDPVNMSSGNMYQTTSDISILARGLPVSILRTYNSRSTYNGHFGYGWTWNYGEELLANPDGSVMYREGDGTEHVFVPGAGGAFVAPAGKHLVLADEGSGWSLTNKVGIRSTFDARGLMVTQSDLNGNTLTIQRDGNGAPTAIVDATGRTAVTFTVANGKVTGATDLMGRKIVYTYDGDDLVSVTDLSNKSWTMAYDLDHNMTSFSDPLGNAQTYSYDPDDRLFHHVDAAGAEEFFHYDIANRQSVLTDRRGGERYIRYDDVGRATLEADPSGNVVTAAFDAQNNRTAVTDSRGNTAAYEYDEAGNIERFVAFDGAVTTASYDSRSRLLTMVSPGGLTTANSYDSRGNLTQTTMTGGGGVAQTSTNTYNAHGELLTMTDSRGSTIALTWSSGGAPASRTDPNNQTTTFNTDDAGRITAIVGPAANTTSFVYDSSDRITSMTDPYGATTGFGFDAAGRRASVTTARGTTTYAYDPEGRVIAVTDPAGATTRTAYNAAGDLIARTDPRGNTERVEYDLSGRIRKRIDANGGVWQLGYCAAVGSTPCDLVDPNGKLIRQAFDKMGRVTSITDSLGRKTEVTYDAAGRRISETDANSNVTHFGYDGASRLTSVTLPGGAVTAYTYDGSGNKLTQKDANGRVWSYKYDAMNRLIEESDPLARKSTYTYDSLGNMKTKTDAKGQTTTYDYVGRRLVKITYPNGKNDAFQYDGLGRRISASDGFVTNTYGYDKRDLVTSVSTATPQYTLTASYEYDAAGNRIKLTNRQSTVTYTYDAANRLTQLTDPLFGSFRFGYDALHRVTSISHPNGVTTAYDHDDVSRLTAIATKNAAGTIIDAWRYGYDAAGNRTSRTDRDGVTEHYRYDAVGQLTEARSAAGLDSFEYDPAGNRTKRSDPLGTTTYSYDVANQLLTAGTTSFGYDANGNVTTKTTPRGVVTFAYDARDRLVEINGVDGRETNVYDPEGRRIDMSGASIENGQVRVFYDLDGNPILDWGTDNQTWTYRVYAPGVDTPLAEYRRINNRKTYLHSDAIGSITAVTNASGDVAYRSTYKPFGEMVRSSYDVASTRLGYTGREGSVSGMMQYRSRYYDPSAGRFLQRDSYAGTPVNPRTQHKYTYAWNQPNNFTDPYGMSSSPDWSASVYDATYLSIVAGAGFVTGWVFWNVTGTQVNAYAPSYGPVSFDAVTFGVGYAISLWPLCVTASSMKLREAAQAMPPGPNAFFGYTLMFSLGFVVGFGLGFTAFGIHPVFEYGVDLPEWDGPVGTTSSPPPETELQGWHFRIKGRSELSGSGLLTVGFDFGATFLSGYTFGW